VTTQVGAFEIQEPVPALRHPRVVAALQPWIDVGSVGTMALSSLEDAWGAKALARLSRPGHFYDFTRYRPVLYRREGQREIAVPNTFVRYVQQDDGQDWLFLHALEPHNNGEEYVDSLVDLMKHLGVRQYCLVGSMYGPVPHTRRVVTSGSASDEAFQERLLQLGVRQSTYEGPTTIVAFAIEQARQMDVETVTLVVQLPAYAQLERDYHGAYSLLRLFGDLYGLSLKLDELGKEGEQQYSALDDMVYKDPRVKKWVQELEAAYDTEPGTSRSEDEPTQLSPELERFLREMEQGREGPESS
jgi:predicted ATP-grasp superfamily ATP-dependent carboligase